MPNPADSFLVARNPDPDSTLPYLLRLPIDGGILLKAGDRWPTTARVYCHPLDRWPPDAEILEQVAVRSCARRGTAGPDGRSRPAIAGASRVAPAGA